ncbi:cobalt transporter CbiM [Euhalothece natronophila Z-M001]|uniref:Cobalt transporter CbiM n=1 Tax=Euhalothece natronophila Z-M001 TaxID=522448 RepID=A0A5B8NNA2_9CHRO|nr:cobalt transporter CbiM [Euhalothece natronophila]QDZ39720.1 cobalt transporter CbiM [Euhalothece natronophila Z-M001]
MHIPDGIVPPTVTITGYAITGGLTWFSLRQINRFSNPTEEIPKASLLTAAFFVASLIHVPVPPSSVHLVLNGLMGVVLGYFAFPAILIGLFFQAVFFQHGGLSTLGINAVIMGLPAILAYHFFQLRHRFRESAFWLNGFAFVAGMGGLVISALIFTGIIITTLPAEIDAEMEQNALLLALVAYSILSVIEGFFTTLLVSFFYRVKPELLSQTKNQESSS